MREDAFDLYGFRSASEKNFYTTLLSVSGVGPKLALTLLSHTDEANLIEMILSEDKTGLTDISGVGKKTAARILLELGEKMAKESLSTSTGPRGGPLDDLRSALANLGYKAPQIDRALQKVKPLADTADLSTLVRKLHAEGALSVMRDTSPEMEMPSSNMMSNSASRNGGAILFLTTFALTRLPTLRSPSLIAPMRRMSIRTEE